MDDSKGFVRFDLDEYIEQNGFDRVEHDAGVQKMLRTHKLFGLRELRILSARLNAQASGKNSEVYPALTEDELEELMTMELGLIAARVENLGGKLALQVQLSDEQFSFPITEAFPGRLLPSLAVGNPLPD
jgi:hypothetical protein